MHSAEGRSNVVVCHLEGLQNECWQNHRKIYPGYYYNNFKDLIPHPSTITRLCILGRVESTWEEKERYRKTSPLILIAITKPPSNKGKEKVQEVE